MRAALRVSLPPELDIELGAVDMVKAWHKIGVAAAVLAGIGAGRARAEFAALTPSSGLSQVVVGNASGQATTSYSSNLGIVSISPRSLTYQAEVDKFSLAGLAGARITSATLTLNVFVAQPLDQSPFALNVATFGSTSGAASPADFATGVVMVDGAGIPLSATAATPIRASLDRTVALQSLVDGGLAAVGFRFTPSLPGNVVFGDLVLNVTYQPAVAAGAVPEPSSLALGLIAGGVGLAGRRRLRRAG